MIFTSSADNAFSVQLWYFQFDQVIGGVFGEEIMEGEDGFEISTDVGRHFEPFKEGLDTVKHFIDRLGRCGLHSKLFQRRPRRRGDVLQLTETQSHW